MTKDEFAATMGLLASTYPQYDMPPETVQVWWSGLGRYAAEDFWNAAEWVCLNDDRFPPLARMRERVQHEARRSAAAPALEAGGRVDPGPLVAMIKAVIQPVTHDHKRGAAGCPTCSKHDHAHGSAQCPRCRELGEAMVG